MKIYIAARYDRRFELRRVHHILVEHGHEPTSRWVWGQESATNRESAANMDLTDVDTADAILFFGEPQDSHNPGGGRWFELGYAYHAKKKCYIILGSRPTDMSEPVNIGKKAKDGHETVFTHLRQIKTFYSLEEVLAEL